MKIVILTLFPGMFDTVFSESVIGKARTVGLVEMEVLDLRDFTHDKHRTADDSPFGGGPGMVMKPEPILEACRKARSMFPSEGTGPTVICLTPQGRTLNQGVAEELAKSAGLIIICGRYEGIDERVIELAGAIEISIGDFILTGGEPAAIVLADALIRLIPGVVGNEESIRADSFSDGLLDHPHYTRPAKFNGLDVPETLLSGNHAEIARWRRKEALKRTLERRPDLLQGVSLNESDLALLKEAGGESS